MMRMAIYFMKLTKNDLRSMQYVSRFRFDSSEEHRTTFDDTALRSFPRMAKVAIPTRIHKYISKEVNILPQSDDLI